MPTLAATKPDSDYARIAQAIGFITRRLTDQPTLDEIAAQVNLSPFHFQRLFCRWAGVTPKRFLQVLTLEQAKHLLHESKPLLEIADVLGLSSGSRLYDCFVHIEAVTPGEYRLGGAGLRIDHAVHDTPFGLAFIALTPRGICRFAFLDSENHDEHLIKLHQTWPRATILENRRSTLDVISTMFGTAREANRPVSLYVSGTNFQVNVWKALLQIPPAQVTSYSRVAAAIGRPAAARAVGTAVGANPVAFLIPCHRVIQESGHLGGYRWGEIRKHALHAWESARHDPLR